MILYGISFVDKLGLRCLLGPAQGRCMYRTREDAERDLEQLLQNGEGRLVDVCGERSRGTFRVDAFDCYDHGDPKGIYVKEEEQEEDILECVACGGPLVFLGTLGSARHFRCRNCGAGRSTRGTHE